MSDLARHPDIQARDKYAAAADLARKLAAAVEARTTNTTVAAAIFDALTLDDHGPGCDGPHNCTCPGDLATMEAEYRT